MDGNVRQLIKKYFPENYKVAVAVAMAESGLNPRATNMKDNHGVCKGSFGIFQLGCLHEDNPIALYDVEYNIKRARELYEESGWTIWGAYTDKRYLAYLN